MDVDRRTGRSRRTLMLVSLLVAAAGGAGLGDAASPVSAWGRLRPMVDDAQIATAKSNLLLFMLDNLPEPGSNGVLAAPCPFMRSDQLGYFVGQQGLTPNLASFKGVTAYRDTDIGTGVLGIVCGQVGEGDFTGRIDPGAPVNVSLDAYSIDGVDATFAEAVASVTGGTITLTGVPTIGGEIGGRCTVNTGAFCAWSWHRDGLVLSLYTYGPADQVAEPQSQQLLISMVQTMLDDLVVYMPISAVTTTTAVAATGSPTKPTIAPVSATTLAPAPVATPAAAPPTVVTPGPTTTLKTLGG